MSRTDSREDGIHGMSNGSASFADTATMQGKLEPPRSLHGVEDAEVIWDTITRRFPNAAPLLCEMETVIERAEDLLRQLRTPCAQGNDTSSSFHTPDSRESNATISMVSDIESFEETNISEQREATENAETQFTYDIHEKQTDLDFQHRSEQSVQCEKKHPCQGYHLTSPPKVDEVVQRFKTSSMDKCHNFQRESDIDVKDNADKAIGVSSEEKLMRAIAETNSLEGWTKMTDNALREWHDDMEDDNDSEIRPNIDRNINPLLMINDDRKCDKIDDKKVSVVKSSATTANYRSAWTILEEYTKRCKVSFKYEYSKLKPNLYVINGDLCGFRANSCAGTQDMAKNELAAEILWSIAERQMDGSKLLSPVCGLLDFSREEMLEITVLNESKLKNASQKLYKVCLEKGESIPEYTINKLKTTQGFKYTAQCVALGRIGIGEGLRKDSAKIAAAESLYQEYIREAEQQST